MDAETPLTPDQARSLVDEFRRDTVGGNVFANDVVRRLIDDVAVDHVCGRIVGHHMVSAALDSESVGVVNVLGDVLLDDEILAVGEVIAVCKRVVNDVLDDRAIS